MQQRRCRIFINPIQKDLSIASEVQLLTLVWMLRKKSWDPDIEHQVGEITW